MLTTDQRRTSHLEEFKWPYLCNGSPDLRHVWFFYSRVFGFGGSNGAIFGLPEFNSSIGENNVRGVIRLVIVAQIFMARGAYS